jgi:hypothetical protein
MCNFFSFVGDGFGNYHCIGWETRQKWIKAKSGDMPDSHTRILTMAGVPPRLQDRWDKYEYNPLTRVFSIDQGVDGHDHEPARAWVEQLDFKRIVEPLIIKPIVNPLALPVIEVTDEDRALLKRWSSVWASVGASPMGASVRASVGDSVGDSVGGSVGDSVRPSVRDSVRDSMWAYVSSFFSVKYEFDFSPAIRLWERGLVPSFDGKIWRLHQGPEASIVYECDKSALQK